MNGLGRMRTCIIGLMGALCAFALGSAAVGAPAVVSVDVAHSKLKVVSPNGGQVHEIDVETPDGRTLLRTLRVGDKITAWATEALLIAVHPA
jgi:hypothetical protein